MSFVVVFKYLHIMTALWMVAGGLGRNFTQRKAVQSQDIHTTATLVQLMGFFDRRMVIPGSSMVLLLGLLTAWVQGWPILGFLQGGSVNWVLASILIYLSIMAVVFTILVPHGKVFEAALQDAVAQGQVTSRLTAAFNDQAVAFGHNYELAALAVIVFLMVAKPF
jgi:uncharacterized membrane protein